MYRPPSVVVVGWELEEELPTHTFDPNAKSLYALGELQKFFSKDQATLLSSTFKGFPLSSGKTYSVSST